MEGTISLYVVRHVWPWRKFDEKFQLSTNISFLTPTNLMSNYTCFSTKVSVRLAFPSKKCFWCLFLSLPKVIAAIVLKTLLWWVFVWALRYRDVTCFVYPHVFFGEFFCVAWPRIIRMGEIPSTLLEIKFLQSFNKVFTLQINREWNAEAAT